MNRFLKTIRVVCLLLPLMVGTAQLGAETNVSAETNDAVYSKLWGQKGELWSPESRLPDFSYAGYHRGERPLPDRTPDVSVKDFGAVGDGKTDDTTAFQAAIAQSAGKTISIPEGQYVITDMLEIRDSGTVLQGAGTKKSILRFPKPLNDIKPNWGATTSGQRTSNYSWSGGFILVRGSLASEKLASVTDPAKRAARKLKLSAVDKFQVGDEFRMTLSETDDQSLAKYLYANDPGEIENLKKRASESFIARITGINQESSEIEFDRPLRTDVRLNWQPTLYSATSSVEEVGIEGLSFEYPETPYGGHFTELGYNAIATSGTRNCWIRNIRVHNSDSGFFISSVNTTISKILFQSDRRPEASRTATGHHGVTLGGQDNLLTQFDFRTRFMHDITVTNGSSGNVAAVGRGIDICFDHHRYAPRANLFTAIDLGTGSRMFQSGGGAKLGRHSAAWETFWGLESEKPQKWPVGWGPDLMNIVGVNSNEKAMTDPEGRWFEPIAPLSLFPINLYQAQLERRLGERNH